MATIEERIDNISSIEVRLKFWQFNMEKQKYNINFYKQITFFNIL
jgi:hypothetical protein